MWAWATCFIRGMRFGGYSKIAQLFGRGARQTMWAVHGGHDCHDPEGYCLVRWNCIEDILGRL